MSKQDVVAQQLAAIQAGEQQVIADALGATFDAGQSEGGGGGFTQEQMDAFAAQKVSDAVAPLNTQIADLTAKDAADVQALADSVAAMAVVQKSLDDTAKALVDMTAKEQLEEQAVSDVNAKILAVQASFDAIKAIFAGLNPPASP